MVATILEAGLNVWRVDRARRTAFFIDAADYYANLHSNLARARRSIFILGWDIDSRVRLLPAHADGLASYLNALVAAREGLHIYLALWASSSIYWLDREAFQPLKLALAMHPRIHICFDDRHPVGASHHHKIVVVDDELAYCGGIDLTGNRWDTSAHDPDNPLRRNPAGQCYAPFHDCQAGVIGASARWLGQLCRVRWLQATGQRLAAPPAPLTAAPFDLGADAIADIPVGIARTVPAYRNQPEVREVERLYGAMIDAATAYIYIECQYFTSHFVCRKLCSALLRPAGPEVVLVAPKVQDSFLAKVTMGALSVPCIERLQAADRFGRFHAYYPDDERLRGGAYINVHAKVMVVDDRYLRVGSSNLNNRSMGLDTECDVVADAEDDARLGREVRRFLSRLLADHTGTQPAQAAEALRRAGSIGGAVASLRSQSPKALVPLGVGPPRKAVRGLPFGAELLDLDQAHPVEQIVDEFVFGTPARTGGGVPHQLLSRPCWTFAFGLAAAAAVAAVPLYQKANEPALVLTLLANAGPVGTLALFAAFVFGGVLFIPLNLLVVAAASLLPTAGAFGLIMGGSLCGAGLGYAVGAAFGSAPLRRLFPTQEALVGQAVAKRDLASMLLVRLFPLAPFALVNLVAGALRVRFTAYLAGTVLGILPGALGMVFFQKSLLRLLARPSLATFAVFSVAVYAAVKGSSYLARRFGVEAKEGEGEHA